MRKSKLTTGYDIKVSKHTILGNREVGFHTAERWAEKLNMSMHGLVRRVRMAGCLDANRIFWPNRKRARRLETITNPFTGITGTRAQHARRLEISTVAFCHREIRYGLNSKKTWHHGPMKRFKHAIVEDKPWEREKFMAIRRNPFTGQESYDYEWAELMNMTEGSFRDRLILNGEENMKSWTPAVAPKPNARVDVSGGIDGTYLRNAQC